jgi:hypothetical protein
VFLSIEENDRPQLAAPHLKMLGLVGQPLLLLLLHLPLR